MVTMLVVETMLDTTMIKSAPTTPTTTKENEKNIKMKKNIMGGAEEDGYDYGDEEYAGGEEHFGEYEDGEYQYDDEPERFSWQTTQSLHERRNDNLCVQVLFVYETNQF